MLHHSSSLKAEQERLQTGEGLQTSGTFEHSKKGYKVSDDKENELDGRDLSVAAENTSERMKGSVNRAHSTHPYRSYLKSLRLRHISNVTPHAECFRGL